MTNKSMPIKSSNIFSLTSCGLLCTELLHDYERHWLINRSKFWLCINHASSKCHVEHTAGDWFFTMSCWADIILTRSNLCQTALWKWLRFWLKLCLHVHEFNYSEALWHVHNAYRHKQNYWRRLSLVFENVLWNVVYTWIADYNKKNPVS